MSRARPSLKELEASRPAFDASLSTQLAKSQAPNTSWVAGDGCNDAHATRKRKEGDEDGEGKNAGEGQHYKVIVPGETEVGPMDMYKLMLGAIVSLHAADLQT